MQDLRLIGVHEDGMHLLLAGPDGERFRVPLDDALRAAARRDRPRLGQLQIEMDGGLRPRDVQAMVRAGASAQEVAERSGWTVEKVHKYEGPILAERVHVAELARQVRVRARGGSGGGTAPTLTGRVAQRMRERGVEPDTSVWDAWRSDDGGRWTVVLTFAAGGRQRQACWAFDLASRTVDAVDDEARWLSEEEPSGSGPLAGGPVGSARATTVYDVEAEGGVTASSPPVRPRATTEPVDLMTAMRERTTVRGRRSGGRRKATPTDLPGGAPPPDDALPLADFSYDPATEEPPPPAHVHPDDDPQVAAAEAAKPAVEPAAPPAPAEASSDAAHDVTEADHQESDAQDSDAQDSHAQGADGPESAEPMAESTPPETSEAPGTPGTPAGEPDPVGEPDPADSEKSAPTRKGSRASVPSWDDIMFGARRD